MSNQLEMGSVGFPTPPIDAFKVLLEISDSAFEQLAQQLSASTAVFLPGKVLKEELSKVLGNEVGSDSVFRAMRWIMRFRDDDGKVEIAFRFLTHFLQIEDRIDEFSADQRALLEYRLTTLLANIPDGVNLQAKAERLTEATGIRLQKVNLICDLRPIFDSDRKTVKGLMPISTLRLVAESPECPPVEFEAILSERDVEQLFDLASNAKQKIVALRELAKSAHIDIPTTELTKS